MTNKIALFLALIVIAVFAVDRYYLDGELPYFLMHKIIALSDWIAIWR